ncbi:hypothetical protein KWH78_18485, partial [Morganella morganii]|uniref:hypothetical protein n=1 Tax=Morganella morganii TaxID=582 RepID=UPI0021D2694B
MEVQYSNIVHFPFYSDVRKNEQQKALRLLLTNKTIFIESTFGSGLLKFIGSTLSHYLSKINFIKVNLEGCITQIQVEEKILADTNLSISALLLHINDALKTPFCIILERISPKISDDTLNYLLRLSSDFRVKNQNIYFIFSSAKKIEQLAYFTVTLEKLTPLEIKTILITKYG